MYLEGRGRNEIARLLSQQGLHVSEGSVGNILRTYRKQPRPSDVGISTSASIDTMGSPTYMAPYGIGQANSNNSNFIPKYGRPLSHIFPNEPEIDFASDISTPFPGFDPSDVLSDPNAAHDPRFDRAQGERYFGMSSNNQEGSPKQHSPSVVEETNEVKETPEESDQPRFSASNREDTPVGIDWDSDQMWERRFVRIVMDDKRQRAQQFQLIAQQRKELEIEKHNLAQVTQSIDQRN